MDFGFWIESAESIGFGIRNPELELVGADANTRFDISNDGNVLILSPVRDEGREADFQAALEKVNARYPRALKKLSE